LLDAALAMNTWEQRYVGPVMHDRIIGALEPMCRRGEMLLIQNRCVYWETHQIGIPGTRPRIGRTDGSRSTRMAGWRRFCAGAQSWAPHALVFGTDAGKYQANIQTAGHVLGADAGADAKRRHHGHGAHRRPALAHLAANAPPP